MIRHDASYPESPRAADFRDDGACLSHDPDMWFPKNQGPTEKAKAAKAKRICGICSVRPECLAHALDEGIDYGIFGGLDETERRALRRNNARKTAAPKDSDGELDEPSPAKPRTLAELFAQRTLRLPGGHVVWTACASVTFKGDNYTPKQIAFELDRGYKPTGTVLTTCDHKGCIQALHLTDAEERGKCGTETAYRRHVAKGEPVDEKCLAAVAGPGLVLVP